MHRASSANEYLSLQPLALRSMASVQWPCLRRVVNFFLVEAETRRRWDIFQAEVTLYWELAVRRCSHPSLTFAQHSRVIPFKGEGYIEVGDNLNKACKCSTGISPLPEFSPALTYISITVSFKCIGANPISLTVLPIPSHYHRDKGTFNLGPCTMVRSA